MRPYRLHVDDADLTDLERRLDAVRWPPEPPHPGWDHGVPLTYLRELVQSWRTEHDWRAFEERLNLHPQFLTEIDGLDVHFLHVRSPHAGATPMILTHGWPSSVAEFLDVIGPLTRPDEHGGDASDAFHLVIPSLPGHGPSGTPIEPGWGVDRVARAWAELMARLGYDHYVAQGGDWGAPVSLRLAEVDAAHVRAVHLNMLVTLPPPDLDPSALDDDEQARLAHGAAFIEHGTGWQRIQATRPQTLAYGLTDSPVGQAAWIAEKFREWTGARERPEEHVDRTHLLDTIAMYWFTNTSGPSAWFYRESTPTTADFVTVWGGPWPLTVPVGVAVLPNDATRPLRSLAEKALPTLVRWTEYTVGGHFTALTHPAILVDDVRAFVRDLR